MNICFSHFQNSMSSPKNDLDQGIHILDLIPHGKMVPTQHSIMTRLRHYTAFKAQGHAQNLNDSSNMYIHELKSMIVKFELRF